MKFLALPALLVLSEGLLSGPLFSVERSGGGRDNQRMVRISLDEMSRDPGKYIREVEGGETVVVMRAERPVAEIRPVASDDGTRNGKPRPAGLAAGAFRVPDDFDAPLPPEILDAFEGR